MGSPSADWPRRIARARRAETLLLRLGWAVLVVSTAALVAEVTSIALGYEELSDGIIVAAGIILGGILAGAAALGSGTNIGINAERMQRDLERDAS